MQDAVVQKMEDLTRLSMAGNLSFFASLQERIALISPTKKDIEALKFQLQKSLTPSFGKFIPFVKNNASRIYVISGGFHEYMDDLLVEVGIPHSHIFANSFIFEGDRVTNGDWNNPLAKDGGKVAVLRSLDLPQPVIVVGDGYTDFEMYQAGLVSDFLAFTEIERRDFLDIHSCIEVKNFDEVEAYITSRYESSGV